MTKPEFIQWAKGFVALVDSLREPRRQVLATIREHDPALYARAAANVAEDEAIADYVRSRLEGR